MSIRAEGVVWVVGGEEHGLSPVGYGFQHRQHPLLVCHVQGGARLVEKHRIGILNHRGADGHDLPLAPAEFPQVLPVEVLYAELLDQGFNPLLFFPAGGVEEVQPVDGAEQQVVPDGVVAQGGMALLHIGQSAGALPEIHLSEVPSGMPDDAGPRILQSGHDLYQGGLPAAVQPYQGVDGALLAGQ